MFRFRDRATPGNAGFTLLELILVMLLFGVVLALALPRFSDTGTAYLKTDSSRVAAYIRYLHEASSTRKVYYRVSFDMGAEELRAEYSLDGAQYRAERDAALRTLKLAEGVTIEDVVVPETGKVNSGVLTVVFAPAGTMDPFTLHLKSGKNFRTLTFNPYSGEVSVEEGYV